MNAVLLGKWRADIYGSAFFALWYILVWQSQRWINYSVNTKDIIRGGYWTIQSINIKRTLACIVCNTCCKNPKSSFQDFLPECFRVIKQWNKYVSAFSNLQMLTVHWTEPFFGPCSSELTPIRQVLDLVNRYFSIYCNSRSVTLYMNLMISLTTAKYLEILYSIPKYVCSSSKEYHKGVFDEAPNFMISDPLLKNILFIASRR